MIAAELRERLLTQAYEHALRSAFAQGTVETGFQFALPQPDDVISFPNGNKALREETHISGYSDLEHALHNEFLASYASLPPIHIPSSFLADAETIYETHVNDLSEIARGLVRATVHENAMRGDAMNRVSTFTDVFAIFACASFAFHEALLHATDALLHIDHAPIAARFMHELFPALLETQEAFALATRRLSHPELTHTVATGAQQQIHLLLTSGQGLGQEPDFFTLHLSHSP